MEFSNEALKSRFTVPDRPTVRQQMRWRGEVGVRAGSEIYERLWQAARPLISEWDSPHLQLDDKLDDLTDPSAADVVMWAGAQVLEHMNNLEDLPKNS